MTDLLTPRECDVLRLLTCGLTNNEIAAELVISERTVQSHVSNMLGKLGLANRTELAVLAVRRGWVDGEWVVERIRDRAAQVRTVNGYDW